MNKGDQDPRLFIEGRLIFLEEWRTNLTPLQNSIASADRAAVDFSLAGLKSMFILNGGALIAVPAFVEILDLGPEAFGSLVDASVLFVSGLVECVLANLTAYLSMREAGLGLVATTESRAAMLKRVYTGDPKGDLAAKEAREEAKADRLGKKARRLADIGLVLFFFAFSAFIGGAILSGLLLTSAPTG